jgi:general secretion pathway protein I
MSSPAFRSRARGRASTSCSQAESLASTSRRGFTLMEVMIAVVIMALGLGSLFASEAGAIRIAQRARTTTVATLLARCKMGEVEEKLAKEGWPGTALDGRDECCDEAEHEGYSCEWKVERIVLPESAEAKTEDEAKAAMDDAKNGKGMPGEGGKSGSSSIGAPLGGGTPDPTSMGVPLNGLPPILGGPASGSGAGGGLGGGSETGGGADPISGMVMSFAFPIMKPIIEEQVRRVTVKVMWKEGEKEQNFEVVQFLVNELPVLPQTNDEDDATPLAPPGGAPPPPANQPPKTTP